MARLNVELPTQLYDQLRKCGDPDLPGKMLKAAAPDLVQSIRKHASVHDRTGAMSRSVKADRPKKKKDVWSIQVKFTGYDPNTPRTAAYPRGTPNAIKAAGIEWGNTREIAQPFLDSAARDAEPQIMNALQAAYTKEVR